MLRISKTVLALVAIGVIVTFSLLLTIILDYVSNEPATDPDVLVITPLPRETSTSIPVVDPTATPSLVEDTRKPYEPIGIEAEILALVNQERARHGLSPYQISEELSHAASGHSSFMAMTDQRSHIGENGTTYNQRIQQSGYAPIVSVNETIGWGFDRPQAVVKWWLNSAIHRPILLSPSYTEMGIGIGSGKEGSLGYYWVATYGSRAADTNDIAVQSSVSQN